MLHTTSIYNFITPISVEILLHGSNQCNLIINKQIFDAVHIFIKKNPKENNNINM